MDDSLRLSAHCEHIEQSGNFDKKKNSDKQTTNQTDPNRLDICTVESLSNTHVTI